MTNADILNTFFSANALSPLLCAVSEGLGCPVIITDSAFHIVSSHCAPEAQTPAYKNASLHGELSALLCAEIEKNMPPFTGEHIRAELEKDICAGYLFCGEIRLGYIIYFSSIPVTKDSFLYEGLLSKQLFLERHCGGKKDSAEEIFSDLLDGKFENEQVFESCCAGTFLSHFKPHSVAVIKLPEAAFSEFEEEALPLRRSLSEFFHASHPFYYKGFVVVFLHEDHDRDILTQLGKKFSLRTVISSRLENLYCVSARFAVLKDILSYASSLVQGDKPFVVYEKDFVPAAQLKKLSLLQNLMDERVRAMLLNDQTHGSALCVTLYTYIICSRSRKQTSARLFTHCNTVSYRLEKIKNEFFISPDSPEDLFPLLFSLALALMRLGRDDLFIKEEGLKLL